MKKNLIGICLIMMLFFIGILSSCGDTACNHKEEIILGEAATCIKEGLSEGKKCSLCNELLVVQKELEALGHKEIVEEAVAATCNKTGKTEGKYCGLCNEVLVAQKEVAALEHIEVIDKAVTPTCSKNGLTRGSHCSLCNVVFILQKEIEKTTHIDFLDDDDIICEYEGCNQKIAPKMDSTLSLTVANAMKDLPVSSLYYVEGIVMEFTETNSDDGIFTIIDENGVTFYLMFIKNEAGETHSQWQNKIVAGDRIKAYGNITKFLDIACMQGAVVTLSMS